MKEEFYPAIIAELKKRNYPEREQAKLKRALSLRYGLKKIPTNIEILLRGGKKDFGWLKKKLLTKPTRTISGVAPVAIMSKPRKCPHGKCAYCPGGVGSYFGEVPQSYTGKEPATMRGIRNKFDSYSQVFNRLEQYALLGHNFEKVELIVMGGTFLSFPFQYQEEFIWGAFKGLNDFSGLFFGKGKFDWQKFKEFFELPSEDLGDRKKAGKIKKKLKKLKGKFKWGELEKEQRRNEKAKVRCVALCIETRPDYCGEKEIKEMLKLGCTRVELGVQHLDDEVLGEVERGHGVEEVVEATKQLRNNFLKVGYHVMPGLPGSSWEKDKKMLERLFSDERFRPDALKIYPCMVTKGTKLYGWWKKGKFKAMETEEAAKLIAEFKENVPEYCRVLRVQRDIPTSQTEAGVGMTNLRQYIQEKYKPKCRCIRCREPKKEKINFKNIKIKIKEYKASEGTEFFISAEEKKKDLLLGFCRLRIFDSEAGIRELHVYGTATGIGEEGRVQHRGLGKKLLKEAERIVKGKRVNGAEEFRGVNGTRGIRGVRRIMVMSGVGVREYYKKLGYGKEKCWVSKKLK